jgi:uridine kinase
MYVIGIAGGTCSGKSTLSEKLEAYYGENCRVFHMDKYFRKPFIKTIAPITGIEYVEHNHPDALLLDELYRDFNEELDSGAHKVVIIEGLFALYLPEILEKLDLKIYVDLDSDERLVRRIKRFTSMGQTFDEVTSRYIDTVRFRHNELIEPTRWRADLVINGNSGDKSVDIVKTYVDSMIK